MASSRASSRICRMLNIFSSSIRKRCRIEHLALREYQAGGTEPPRFDAVLCSVDVATKEALVEKGVLAFGTEALTAGEAIAEFEEANPAGSTAAMVNGGCCGGHGHDEEHEHAHEGGGCCGGGQEKKEGGWWKGRLRWSRP